jgi:hypothetical protein
MTRDELFNMFKSLVEGKPEPSEWIEWWTKNKTAAEKIIGAKQAAQFDLRPHSPFEGTHNCQNVAETILQEVGISAKRSMRYVEIYMKESEAAEKEKGKLLKPRIDLLKDQYPTLHKCLYRNAKKIETFEPGATEAEISGVEKTLKLRLPAAIRDFFKLTKQWEVEGFQWDLSLLFEHPGDKSAPDGKRYLCLANYFMEADGDQILIDVTKPSDDPQILYYGHSANGAKIRVLAKNWKEFAERLPKQYLNQMFFNS